MKTLGMAEMVMLSMGPPAATLQSKEFLQLFLHRDFCLQSRLFNFTQGCPSFAIAFYSAPMKP